MSNAGLLRLVVEVTGIYSTFLIWALIQERLGTTPYTDAHGGPPHIFKAVVFLNTVQSATSTLSALFYLLSRRTSTQTLKQVLGLELHQEEKDVTRAFLASILQCAVLHSLSSPFAFASLRHIDYPTMILGKSCKLVPVMLMNILLYRRRFAPHKYAVVALVSLGIAVFTFNQPSKQSKGPANSSALGLGLLLVSLAIDGATNSTQDEIFTKFRISGPQMMFWMNLFATVLTALSLVSPLPNIPLFGMQGAAAGSELRSAIAFIRSHPAVLRDILAYGAAGSLGQLFIFDTLQHFGSLTLVTITVTRKLFTMLLSVVVYNHKLNLYQWAGVAIVFLAIVGEAQLKRKGGLNKKVIEQEQTKAKVKAL